MRKTSPTALKSTPDPTTAAIDAVCDIIHPKYWNSAFLGQSIESSEDVLLASRLADALKAGANPNARTTFRKGVKGSLLTACLILNAWRSAQILLLAGANPNNPTSGALGAIPPLFFAVRTGIPAAMDIAALMIEKGADPNANAPDDFAFDLDIPKNFDLDIPHDYACHFDQRPLSSKGSMFKWMVFHDNRPAMIAAAHAKSSARTWSASLELAVEKLDLRPYESGKLTSEIESVVLESHGPISAPSATLRAKSL